jgi:A/G-specific adenine glycosylase
MNRQRFHKIASSYLFPLCFATVSEKNVPPAGATKDFSIPPRKINILVRALLDWFQHNARTLPWRETRDPYAIWVSEIMLQQTQVKTVIPYWERWMETLPTIQAAAAASPATIHKLWEGLGYYTRVRNLQRATQEIIKNHNGHFPEQFADILALPGIGPYTAGAIASIAFNQPQPILDGNVIRVLTRLFAIPGDPRQKEISRRLWEISTQLVQHAATVPSKTPQCSHLNQSLMELGALICTPRSPDCPACPLRTQCAAHLADRETDFPQLAPRQAATARHFHAYVISRHNKYLVHQRPAGQVNAHLWEFPNHEIPGDSAPSAENLRHTAQQTLGLSLTHITPFTTIRHTITRYRITLIAHTATISPTAKTPPHYQWFTLPQLQQLAFTSAHKKILQVVSEKSAGDPRRQ